MNQRKIIFMGTPKIAATVLQSLLDANIAIELVVTQPDKNPYIFCGQRSSYGAFDSDFSTAKN